MMFLPLVSDANCGVDGTREDNVVEGKQELGEDVGVEGGLEAERPLPNQKQTAQEFWLCISIDDIGTFLYLYMSQLLLLGKVEYGDGPIFKVVLEC